MFKRKLFVFAMLVVALLAISAVSAGENVSDTVSLDDSSDVVEVDEVSDDEISQDISSDEDNLISSDENQDDEVLAVEKSADVLSSSVSARSFNIGGYKFTVPASGMKQLKDAKNGHYSLYLKYYTGKYVKKTYKEPKYKVYKKTVTKRMVIYKIFKSGSSYKQVWTKNWKSKVYSYAKHGYKVYLKKRLGSTSGKIWAVFKKTTTKKVKYYKKVTSKIPVRGCVYVNGQTGKASVYNDSGSCWGYRTINI